MKCPFCQYINTQVLESRLVEEDTAIRRRRECLKCHKRFTTYEHIRNSVLWVIKKDGKREPFEREKVKRGILRAIEKRPVALKTVDEIIGQVEREMLNQQKEEINSQIIGNAVMKRLKKIDKVAWLRFASVYLEFEKIKDFEKIIKNK
ncbi:transcriptional regulator NrdR [Candidatus Woesebacteria bacterium RIFOXYB1_FULL_38_16]|uniref:Transcriptional repressor NrdR n=1 Tax=Candidatus Woesebacteria bacterium RIFOXYB1_FULL_38_16 TaxID=1802538 RepID=A0A1F8CS85_9BACT|nr:MAG: transcriptional regulator NrdR [Candidatus Woesebacteria bacterium RIFOXYA1_FULL_38_9]OGM79111.1 MAG: transcriptional regulator NrdR [Candidatus Woesebacteria bacterium RIFOXYB1_FULL_38_16]